MHRTRRRRRRRRKIRKRRRRNTRQKKKNKLLEEDMQRALVGEEALQERQCGGRQGVHCTIRNCI